MTLFKIDYDSAGVPTTVRTCSPRDGKWSDPRSVAAGAGKLRLSYIESTPKAQRKVTAINAASYGKATGACLMCGRKLSDTDSQNRGYGPECASKLR